MSTKQTRASASTSRARSSRPPLTRSEVMARVKGKDTRPERAVRSLLHAMGYRFRLHRRDLPGSPDIVLPGRSAVIFVHGCFWHGHGCKRGSRAPKSNADYWTRKLAGNVARDARSWRPLAGGCWWSGSARSRPRWPWRTSSGPSWAAPRPKPQRKSDRPITSIPCPSRPPMGCPRAWGADGRGWKADEVLPPQLGRGAGRDRRMER